LCLGACRPGVVDDQDVTTRNARQLAVGDDESVREHEPGRLTSSRPEVEQESGIETEPIRTASQIRHGNDPALGVWRRGRT
jgi:hypothetical protein